jgi:hypothetical protein
MKEQGVEHLLDDIGWKILSELQQNARMSFAELGRIVGLSTPAVDVLQLSGRLAGDVKELQNDSRTRDLQMAADRTRPHTLCGAVVSSLFSFAARC